MSEKAKTAATRYLLEMGVQLLTGKMVKDYNGHTLLLSDGQEIPSSTVIWAAGVKGNFIEGIPNEVRMLGRAYSGRTK
jgi:NADH dehydrogenase